MEASLQPAGYVYLGKIHKYSEQHPIHAGSRYVK